MAEDMQALKEQATNAETLDHIQNVRNFLGKVIVELLKRAEAHDQSKLRDPELATFTEFTPKLRASTYGSPEYHAMLKEMKPALEHHYSHNRHHPEHFHDGIQEMTLVDLIEMLCDWKAATMRHENGDMHKSILINQKRFQYSDELRRIFENTAVALGFIPRF
jgi:hypothetical protein